MTAGLRDAFVELIRRASSDLPEDLVLALERGRRSEVRGTLARSALDLVLENVARARELSAPMCQDTGTNIWYVYHPAGWDQRELRKAIVAATRQATKLSYLRANAVDSLTGANSGDNTGLHAPVVHFEPWSKRHLAADLLLKGGGCENVSTQYALPAQSIGAGRDLEGVRRVVVDAITRAQGKGCAPGYVGVGIGGDRMTGHVVAKEMIFRLVHDRNPDRRLDALERRLVRELNGLGIGPMGFGGKTTVLGVKIGAAHRLPASYFVSVAYECWACRRASLELRGERASYGQVAQIARPYLEGGTR